MELVDGV